MVTGVPAGKQEGWQTFALHDSPLAQIPHDRVPPQPFEMLPHSAPALAQVLGVQQTPDVHVWPEAQLPHGSVPPHPSDMLPQFFPCA